MAHPSMSTLLRQKAFIRFWLARLTGVMANQMLMVAVGWHMYDLTGSAWDLGLVGLFQFVPVLLMTLPAGHAADRWHRGKIFAACMAMQALVATAMALSAWNHNTSRELILGLSILLGVARAFQMPAQQAITPLLVPQSMLQRAVTFSTSGMSFSVITGPALGGVIYIAGATAVYACCTALLLLATSLSLGVRYSHHISHNAVSWHSTLAGFAFVWRKKVLFGALSLDLFAVLLGGATALLPIYAKDILDTGPEGLGFLRAAPSVGSLLMSLALMRWPLRRRVGRTLLASVAIFGLANLVFGLSTYMGLSLLALAIAGAADSISVVIRQTIMQLDTPDEIRGRVSAVNSIFIGGSNQLGEFESGALAEAVGPVASVVIGGLGTLAVAALWFRLFPGLAQRDSLEKSGASG